MSPESKTIKKGGGIQRRLEKWNSIGNDFLVTENEFTTEEIIFLSDRKFGIGCDQFIIQNNLFIKIFNSDGSASEMCGNALTCLAIRHFRKTRESAFFFDILKNKIKITMEDGTPSIFFPPFTNFRKEEAPFFAVEDSIATGNFYQVLHNKKSSFFYIELGNPHLICILSPSEDINDKIFCAPGLLDGAINKIGSEIQKQFPKTGGINVSFVLKVKENTVFIRTFERGVGETLSCGSAAVCGAFCAYTEGIILSNEITVESLGSAKFNEFSIIKIKKEAAALCGQGAKIAEIILPNL